MKISYKKPIISEIFAPFLPIKIFDETQNFSYPQNGTIDALIDTGYDGYLVIPLKIFNILNLISSEFVKDYLTRAETITGENVELQTSLGYVEIPQLDLILSIEIDTTSFCSEILIGRQLLEQLLVTLNGPQHELIVEK